jgi:hypothetical protein
VTLLLFLGAGEAGPPSVAVRSALARWDWTTIARDVPDTRYVAEVNRRMQALAQQMRTQPRQTDLATVFTNAAVPIDAMTVTRLANTAGGNITLTLAASTAANAGRLVEIIKTDAANTLTIAASGGQQINDVPTLAITDAWAVVRLRSTSLGWVRLT